MKRKSEKKKINNNNTGQQQQNLHVYSKWTSFPPIWGVAAIVLVTPYY